MTLMIILIAEIGKGICHPTYTIAHFIKATWNLKFLCQDIQKLWTHRHTDRCTDRDTHTLT